MESLLPIGRFARLTGLTVKALRHMVDHQRRTALRSAELRAVLQGLQPLIDGKETVMDTASEALERETHRRLGIDLFNRAWTLMEKDGRTQEEDDELLHCAHASAYHWLHGGATDANRARSQWQCSRAHALVGQAEGAIHHAERCLAIVEAAPEVMEQFDLPAAYEALARAHAVAGNSAESRRYLELGLAETANIEDEDDRAIIDADLATIPV